MKTIHKKTRLFILLFVILGAFIFYKESKTSSTRLQEDISQKIIRLHIVAASDDSKDQALKLNVRDAIVNYVSPLMEDISSVDEAREFLCSNIDTLQDVACKAIENEGASYNVNVCLNTSYFPTKMYGDMILPPGDYEALTVTIGNGKGHNWWCVMYPSLCFIDCGCVVLPDSSKEKLQDILTYEEYCSIISDEDSDIDATFGFRFVDWLRQIL